MENEMKSIWFFVGLLMITLGGLILVTGIYLYFHPETWSTRLAHTHPNLWWGAIMIIFGILMYKTKG